MSLVHVDSQKCVHCGTCIEVCPIGLLGAEPSGIPCDNPGAENMCMVCGHCISSCPHDALQISKNTQKLSPLPKAPFVEAENVKTFLKSRRSVRQYQNKPISKDVFEQILDVTRWAPTAMNGQPVQWVVFQNKDDVHKIAGVVIEGFRKSQMLPAIVQVWDKGKDMVLRGAPHLVLACVPKVAIEHTRGDCIIALTYLELAAHAQGIGTCWAGMLMLMAEKYPPVLEALQLPSGLALGGAMMLGYPKYKYHRLPPRKPAQVNWK